MCESSLLGLEVIPWVIDPWRSLSQAVLLAFDAGWCGKLAAAGECGSDHVPGALCGWSAWSQPAPSGSTHGAVLALNLALYRLGE